MAAPKARARGKSTRANNVRSLLLLELVVSPRALLTSAGLPADFDEEVEVHHDQADPFFGLQAVLDDESFGAVRGELRKIKITVGDDQYVECLKIERKFLREAMGEVEKQGAELRAVLDQKRRQLGLEPVEGTDPFTQVRAASHTHSRCRRPEDSVAVAAPGG